MTTAPRILSRREARHAHAARRARERYALPISSVDVAVMEGQIFTGSAWRVRTLDARASLYLVQFGDKRLFAVYLEDDRCITTFLSPQMVQEKRRARGGK